MGAAKPASGSVADRALNRLIENYGKLTKKQRANFSARTKEIVNQGIRNKSKTAGEGNSASGKTAPGR